MDFAIQPFDVVYWIIALGRFALDSAMFNQNQLTLHTVHLHSNLFVGGARYVNDVQKHVGLPQIVQEFVSQALALRST